MLRLGLGAAACAGHATIAPRALSRAQRTPIADAAPIDAAERAQRLARVQQAMRRSGIAALLVEAGSTLEYFTGVRWGRSERLTGALLPVEGEILVVTPFFEEPRVREMLGVPAEVRTWQEDESPFALLGGWLRERRLGSGPIAIEQTVRAFVIEGLRTAAPDAAVASGGALVDGIRMIKSPTEIALMQRATDITIAAYRQVAAQIVPGIGGPEIGAALRAAMVALGGAEPWGSAQVGPGSALPHGSRVPANVGQGSVVLMDIGCGVGGYRSDVSRTMVLGAPSAEQRKVWNQVHQGQQTAIAAARLGRTCGSVDDAVRAYYEAQGYGPRYALPGLSHRTGHGIGMDVHEPVNLVHGEQTVLAPGMCFSNEPGLYLPGKFGIRLEDCFYMTPSGPRFFSAPPPSIDDPFG
ncbi:M24 family metallopeptidase [Sphingomonas hengshuiensis]|uniref:Peptidase n=1 Tax=Sphingomonas hengshuiensis TaxID=1609977 RepID=A0A7U4J679_9SPHN|nr:Xaa-Pro peptidase family protein [Sphingomonas hengshuiensis]AJP70998.1 peptidase [Sphingomonas hengshuiensis]